MARIGIVGLGKMGQGVAKRLLAANTPLAVYNRSFEKAEALGAQGAYAAHSLEELVKTLEAPRIVITYLPAGVVTDEHLADLLHLLSPGDILVDGGNSRFIHSKGWAKSAYDREIGWADIGTSGGIGGEKDGYCLMVGATQDTYDQLLPFLTIIAQEKGVARVGEAGAGHYTKMVHNAIEYGMLGAIAEGLTLLQMENVNAEAATEVWQHGSIIRSFLIELAAQAVKDGEGQAQASTSVVDNGTARWAVEDAIEKGLAMPTITSSLYARLASQDVGDVAKTINQIRHYFGGHPLEEHKE